MLETPLQVAFTIVGLYTGVDTKIVLLRAVNIEICISSNNSFI